MIAAITKEEGTDVEYNDALLKVIHDEEPKGVAMGVNIQVTVMFWSLTYDCNM